MTLDTLTRAQAETSHVRLQSSLAQAALEFRERFQRDELLFRCQPPGAGSGASAAASDPPGLEEAELVREERVRQCCRRVRVWRRLAPNPLLQYKQQQQQQLAAARAGGGAGKKSDRRMHTTQLLALITDVYELRAAAEAEAPASDAARESLAESVARYVGQRAGSRRAAVDQLQSVVATVLHAPALGHRRVSVFGSLCGLLPSGVAPADGEQEAGAAAAAFGPPERFQAFLRVLTRLHRCKLSAAPANARAGEEPAASASLGDVVFHHAGVSQHTAQRLVAELFREDAYWNLRFWHAPCRELGVDYAWPPGAIDALQARAVALAACSRNALLNATRKIDTDALLELLLLAWTQRAREVHALLDAATDAEERAGATRLQLRERELLARAQRPPATSEERALFEELADEFWNAPVPWASARLQTRLAQTRDAAAPPRPLGDLRALFAEHIAGVEEAQRPWEWRRWRWDSDWEWGALIVREDDQIELK